MFYAEPQWFCCAASHEAVFWVAATDTYDVIEVYSNYGSWVDLCAPGRNVAPDRDDKYWSKYCYDENFSGTSCAAPFVAGVAALVWSCNLEATNVQVRNALENTADNIDGLNPGYSGLLGHGRVNALEAVKVFRPVPPPPGDCNHSGVVDGGDPVYLLNYLFGGGDAPDPFCIGDVNDNGVVSLGDAVYLLGYLYKGQAPPLDGCD